METIYLHVEDSSLEDFESLSDWLGQEPELRGTTTTHLRAPAAGEMGSAVDVVAVAVGSGGALTILATSLKAWLERPRRSDVRIKARGADGRTVEMDANRVSDVEGLLRAVLAAVEEQPDAPA